MPIILLNEARVNNREEALAFSTYSYLNVIILLNVFRALDEREYEGSQYMVSMRNKKNYH